MSDIVCSSCVIKDTQEFEVLKFADVDPGQYIPTKLLKIHRSSDNVIKAIKKLGVPKGEYKGFSFKFSKETREVDLDKSFDGTSDDALAAGWQENEFGWVCQDCAGRVEDDSDSRSVSMGLELLKAIVPDITTEPLNKHVGGHERFLAILKKSAPTVISENFYIEANLLGWFPLILDACLKIEAINLTKPVEERIKADQIKEKLGTLRFYTDYYTPEVEAIIDAAESESCRTCYYCGDLASIGKPRSWMLTLCKKCDNIY